MPIDQGILPRLEYLHAGVLGAGTISTLLGIAMNGPRLLVTAGVCFVTSGLLIWAGSRITLSGPLGDALRLALGRRRVLTIRLRIVFWIALGLLLLLLGGRALRDGNESPLDPLIAAY